jgi:peptide/nickel transport system ATP-binding protein
MGPTALSLTDFSVCFEDGVHKVQALDEISLTLERGGSLGIIGESGSGKTTLALAVMGLLAKTAVTTGGIFYEESELSALPERERYSYRWRKIAIVFQNSLDVLNPVLTIGEQVGECLRRHSGLTGAVIGEKVRRLLESVNLDPVWAGYYPHQLSGGMRQRVLIAMALACDPRVLIIDEPTNALDAPAKNEIIKLLNGLHQEKGFGLIVISHELPAISNLTTRLAVIYRGRIVEEGMTRDILMNPLHPYTRGLINAAPAFDPFRDLWGIPDGPEERTAAGCVFYPRCNQHQEQCARVRPILKYAALEHKVACNRGGIVTLLKGTNISKAFQFRGNSVQACADCTMEIRSGEVIALIGESGSGKTTLANVLAGILAPDGGAAQFGGETVSGNKFTRRRGGIQIVFQDPFSAINEQFTVEDAVREPLDLEKRLSVMERKERVIRALDELQLPGDEAFLTRRCYVLSGGQRQRVALARALVMEPSVLIADEISSMLDPSTQANILRLLKGIQNRSGFAMVYITHDMAVARKIADRVYVMRAGKIIENGPAAIIFRNPVEEYTQKLLDIALSGHNFS